MINFVRTKNNRRIPGILLVIFMVLTISTYGNAEVVIEGKLIREKSVQSGEIYKEHILIKNNGTDPAQIKVYQTDYLFSHQGWSHYPEPAGQIERSNANWISFNPSFLVIPPKEKAVVNCILKVPPDNSLTGTYWSMLMIEEIIGDDEANQATNPDSRTAQTTQSPDFKINIQQVMRYGIQLVSNIGDSGIRNIKILDRKLFLAPPKGDKENNKEKREGEYILQLDAKNTGERLLRPLVWVELYDQQGSFAGKYEGGKFIIYPGNSVRYKMNLKNLLPQEYKALVVLDNGDENIWGNQFTLNL